MATQFAHSVKRITISGTCYNGAEIWSTGFYVGSVGSDVSNPTQAFADAVRTAWTAFFTNSTSAIGNAWKTDNVKVAQISATGITSESNVVYAPYGTAITGGGGTQNLPPQIAMVCSLENAGARGLAAKGRMYLPGVGAPVGTDGKLTSTTALALANNMKTFLDAVNAAAPTAEDVILASQGNRVKDAQGKYQPVPGTAVNAVVNRVRVGSVYDTQRRRRNQMVEVYQSATLA
jgi:hypothetical protein